VDPQSALLSLQNPVFATYALAASIMLLKLLLQPWMTVARMMQVRGGFRSPEDTKKSPLNPNPDPSQIAPNEYVERSRRLNLNDLESIPAFLAAGLLFVLVEPPLLLAQILNLTPFQELVIRPENLLGHTINTAEIAPVGDRDPQVA
jgi:glutathione S-transferase